LWTQAAACPPRTSYASRRRKVSVRDAACLLDELVEKKGLKGWPEVSKGQGNANCCRKDYPVRYSTEEEKLAKCKWMVLTAMVLEEDVLIKAIHSPVAISPNFFLPAVKHAHVGLVSKTPILLIRIIELRACGRRHIPTQHL